MKNKQKMESPRTRAKMNLPHRPDTTNKEAHMKRNFEMRKQPQHYRAKELLKLIKSEWAENKDVWFMNCYVGTDIKTILLTLDEIEDEIRKLGGLKDHEVKIVAGTARKLAEDGLESFVLFKTIQFERVTPAVMEKLANEAKTPTA